MRRRKKTITLPELERQLDEARHTSKVVGDRLRAMLKSVSDDFDDLNAAEFYHRLLDMGRVTHDLMQIDEGVMKLEYQLLAMGGWEDL